MKCQVAGISGSILKNNNASLHLRRKLLLEVTLMSGNGYLERAVCGVRKVQSWTHFEIPTYTTIWNLGGFMSGTCCPGSRHLGRLVPFLYSGTFRPPLYNLISLNIKVTGPKALVNIEKVCVDPSFSYFLVNFWDRDSRLFESRNCGSFTVTKCDD